MGALGLISHDEMTQATRTKKNIRFVTCSKEQDFFKYVNQNMKDLGIPPPETVWSSVETSLKIAGALLAALDTIGPRATITEMTKHTSHLKKVGILAGLLASGYVGAYLGSLIVASGRYAGCGTTIADAIFLLQENKLNFKGSKVFFANNPEILTPSMPNREAFVKRHTID